MVWLRTPHDAVDDLHLKRVVVGNPWQQTRLVEVALALVGAVLALEGVAAVGGGLVLELEERKYTLPSSRVQTFCIQAFPHI